MNKITGLSVFGVALTLFHSIAYCGDASTGKMDFFPTPISPSASAISLSEVAKGLKNQALLYASVVTLEGQASFKDIDPAFRTLPGTLHLMLNLKEYAYDFEPIHSPGDNPGATACACDGTTYQELRKRDGKLLISKVEPSSSLPLQMGDFVFMPDAYFTNEERNCTDPGHVHAGPNRWNNLVEKNGRNHCFLNVGWGQLGMRSIGAIPAFSRICLSWFQAVPLPTHGQCLNLNPPFAVDRVTGGKGLSWN